MTEIPTWWLILSALFFVANIVFFAALIYVTVVHLVPLINQTNSRVTDLANKVEKVATKVELLAEQMNTTVGSVGQKASGIMGSLEIITQSAAKQFERFSPLLVGAMTAVKLVRSLQDAKESRTTSGTIRKAIERKTKPKRLFGIF